MEKGERTEREKTEKGREEKNSTETKERVTTSVFLPRAGPLLIPTVRTRTHTHTCKRHKTLYVKPESLKGNHILKRQIKRMCMRVHVARCTRSYMKLCEVRYVNKDAEDSQTHAIVQK